MITVKKKRKKSCSRPRKKRKQEFDQAKKESDLDIFQETKQVLRSFFSKFPTQYKNVV